MSEKDRHGDGASRVDPRAGLEPTTSYHRVAHSWKAELLAVLLFVLYVPMTIAAFAYWVVKHFYEQLSRKR